MQTSLDLIRFGAHFGKASISHPVLVICDQPATNPRLQGCKGDLPTYKSVWSNTLMKNGGLLWMLTYIFIKRMVSANNTDHCIYRSLVYHSGGSRWWDENWPQDLPKGRFRCVIFSLNDTILDFRWWRTVLQIQTRWMPGRSLDHVESFAAVDDQQATFLIQNYILVGGFNPPEKYWSNWKPSPI